MVKDTYYFAHAEKSPDRVHRSVRKRFYGPTMNAVEAAQKSRKSGGTALTACGTSESQNKTTDAGTFIPATFMRVTVSL